MVVPLILMVLAQCTASLSTSRNYHFVNLKKNWFEAQAYCREHFLDLATMETQEEWARVNQKMVENSGGNLVWMGLYDDVDDWRWSVDGAPLDFTEIASLPQWFNEHNDERHCVSWWNGHLHDHRCHHLFNSVCYNKTSDSYVPVLVLMTWESAQQHCREMHMDLTSLRGQQEKDRVSGVVDATSHWWIGLSRGPHKWSDGSNSLFRAWYSSEPSSPTEDCGCMLVDGWHDCSCAYELPFICTVPYWTVFRVQLRMARSVDLNEAQIRDSVEMEIQNNLRHWGIRPEFKVKWMRKANGDFLSKNVTRLAIHTFPEHFKGVSICQCDENLVRRENFIDLVSMETEEDWADVRQLVADWDVGGVWMGLYDDVKDWRWSVDGAPLDFTQIASLPQLFNGHKSEMHCVAWYNNTLQDHPCHSGFFSVCYDESSSSYVPFSVHRSWESAQQHCREAYTDLTSVRGPQEVEIISGLVDSHSHWWIGLSRGPRKWSDGSNSSLRVWAPSQPYGANQDCGCALAEGWHDCRCSMKWPFICRAQTTLVFKVGVQTAGSINLNDPRTQESFQMQIGKQMRNQGIHNRLRLRWMKRSDG